MSASLLALAACSGSDSGTNPLPPEETPAPTIVSLSPSALVEHGDFVIQGTDFSPTPSDNVVTIDGERATVTTATSTTLSVTVPAFDCRPQRTVDVQVDVSGKSSNPVSASVTPADFIEGEVGELRMISQAADFCLQFPPAPAGAGEYLVGIGSAAEAPDQLLDVAMTADAGEAAPVALAAPAARLVHGVGSTVGRTRGPAPLTDSPLAGHFAAEQRIRQWERQALDAWGSSFEWGSEVPGDTRRSAAPAAVPDVGEELQLKVVNFDNLGVGNPCNDPTSITTVVRVVGERGIFVTDVENPLADPITDAELQALSDAFDSYVYDTDTRYFGDPLDLDRNGRILIVFTIEINRALDGQIGGAVTVIDFIRPDGCPASNLGEIYYARVPDPEDVAGTGSVTHEDATEGLVKVLAHEFVHILQISNRLRIGAPPPWAPWLLEGQAQLGREVVAHAALGLGPGADHDGSVALDGPGAYWYQGLFKGLGGYFGYTPEGDRHPDAPEACTLLFLDVFAPTACELGSGYGAAWSFFRFLADRYGPTWPGEEAGLMRDLITAHPTLSGTAKVEALLGRPFQEVFAEWAAMLYLDGQVPEADPSLTMSSWDLGGIMAALDPPQPLDPGSRPLAAFTTSLSVRGGSTAYTLFTDEAPRPALAIRVRRDDGGVLADGMKPVLWVVRTR